MELLPSPSSTLRWLTQRLVPLDLDELQTEHNEDSVAFQVAQRNQPFFGGYQGRPEKDPDVCYSFWVGGAIEVKLCPADPSAHIES